MVNQIKKGSVWLLWQADTWGTILSSRLVKWTGKSTHAIHPKHFLQTDWQQWYLPYINRNAVVLDLGCANGMHTLACAAHCQTIYGFDYNPKQLAIAHAKAAEAGLTNVHFAEGNVETRWDFADASFDTVLFLDVLEHLYEREQVMAEVGRVLKPGGLLLLSIPQRDTQWKQWRGSVGLPTLADPDHKFEYTRQDVEAMLARTGFVLQEIMPTVYDTPFAGWIDLAGGLSLGAYRRLAQWKRDAALRHPAEATGFRIVAQKQL
ncbi:MAG: class I SAM-dependent methyltransferase [Caldilineaceae bacterium]|nr:class I SAM-dependent methyltransferase [Caldilineaceae bacterium]